MAKRIGIGFLGGAGVGAGLMYLLDPTEGRHRRARALERARTLVRRDRAIEPGDDRAGRAERHKVGASADRALTGRVRAATEGMLARASVSTIRQCSSRSLAEFARAAACGR